MQGVLLALGLTLCLAAPAGAVSQAYLVGPGAQFTPTGGQAEAISGAFEIEPSLFSFRFLALDLAGSNLDLTLAPYLPIPGYLELVPPALGVILPETPDIDRLLVERTTIPPLLQGGQYLRELVLRTSSAGVPANQLVFDSNYSLNFPREISLDLELLEIILLAIYDPFVPYGTRVSTLSTTTLGTISLSATPVPEPGTALLLGGGFALLAASGSRTDAASRPRQTGARQPSRAIATYS